MSLGMVPSVVDTGMAWGAMPWSVDK